MESLERYRTWNDRATNRTLGRLASRSRAFDSEVRADAVKWDILRLPVDPDAVFPMQADDGTLLFVVGLDEIGGPGVF